MCNTDKDVKWWVHELEYSTYPMVKAERLVVWKGLGELLGVSQEAFPGHGLRGNQQKCQFSPWYQRKMSCCKEKLIRESKTGDLKFYSFNSPRYPAMPPGFTVKSSFDFSSRVCVDSTLVLRRLGCSEPFSFFGAGNNMSRNPSIT